MDNFRLNDVEAIRVMRAGGNLRVRGVTSGDTLLQCDSEPQIRRVENRAEILIPGNATLEVAPGVAFEILECAGNLDIEDITAPLALGRVRGNLRARRVGSIAIRGEVAGNLSLDEAQALEGEQVNGNLRVEGARSIKFRTVAGNAECGTIEGDVSFEEVRGSPARVRRGPRRCSSRGGQARSAGRRVAQGRQRREQGQGDRGGGQRRAWKSRRASQLRRHRGKRFGRGDRRPRWTARHSRRGRIAENRRSGRSAGTTARQRNLEDCEPRPNQRRGVAGNLGEVYRRRAQWAGAPLWSSREQLRALSAGSGRGHARRGRARYQPGGDRCRHHPVRRR